MQHFRLEGGTLLGGVFFGRQDLSGGPFLGGKTCQVGPKTYHLGTDTSSLGVGGGGVAGV